MLGGGNRTTVVTGPLGEPVEAAWRLEDGVALIEAAQACGLTLAGGRRAERPAPRDEPRRRRADRGCDRGRRGADRRRGRRRRLDRRRRGRSRRARTAARRPGRGRLRRRRALPRRRRSLRAAEGSDAGAGRRSARAAREDATCPTNPAPARRAASPAGSPRSGRRSSPDSTSSRTRLDLDEPPGETDLVITGEGLVDATSLTGKVVGGVLARAAQGGVEALVVAGDVVTNAARRRRISRGTLRSRASARRARGVPRGGRREGARDRQKPP